jgi:Fe-S-cluster-containing hydrogenase component 2
MVCSFQQSGKFSPSISRVRVLKDDRYGLDYPIMCRQCDDCPPLDSCPVEALFLSNGVIKVNEQTCIGCGKCVELCNYEAIHLYQGKAIICDQCNGEPACVNRCPTNALDFSEVDSFSEHASDALESLKVRWEMND